MSSSSFLFFCCLFGLTYGWLGRNQYVNVTGRLLCHGSPAPKVRVVLGEYDWPDNNDILAETESDEEGIYSLSGTETETFTIQPFIGIAHFCPILLRFPQKCLRVLYMTLPKDIVSKEHVLAQVKIADINLEKDRDSEKIICDKNMTEWKFTSPK